MFTISNGVLKIPRDNPLFLAIYKELCYAGLFVLAIYNRSVLWYNLFERPFGGKVTYE